VLRLPIAVRQKELPVIWSLSESYWWRKRRGYVLWPLLIGIALCAFGLWSALAYEHNQAVFRAHAVRTTAVIDSIYTSAPSQDYDAPTFAEYALVRFVTLGSRARARVLVASDCRGVCVPTYRIGQTLTVYYDPDNLRYAKLKSQLRGPSATSLTALLAFGSLGLVLIGAAVVNMHTA